jgi:hypothetical protein
MKSLHQLFYLANNAPLLEFGSNSIYEGTINIEAEEEQIYAAVWHGYENSISFAR